MRLLAIALAMILAACATASAQELTLKRVMLSNGGIGYFEYEAEITGDADVKLTVRADQVDDILKSLVVYDDKGAVGGLVLPGKQPLVELTRDLPFTLDALATPAGLLTALKGAEVKIGGAKAMTGRIISVETEVVTTPDGKEINQIHRVTLMTSEGMRQFVLQQVESLQFTDANLQAQVGRALGALETDRAKDARTLTLGLRGTGKRLVRAAYVVSVPVWKAAYRLTLPADPLGAKSAMQGWAVIENMSGQDWNNVDLTLVSGQPVTFHQALYEAYYVSRPEIPIEILGRILPRADRGSVALDDDANKRASLERGRDQFGAPKPKSTVAPAPAPMAPGGALNAQMVPSQIAGGDQQILAQEAVTQVSFKFPKPVTVQRGSTLSLPIIDREVPGKRLAVYQPATAARNPLAALHLENDGDSGLPAGIVTIYERTNPKGGDTIYVGDAQLKALPAGEKRLITYAVDQKVTIEREINQRQRLAKGTIANGVLRYTVIENQITNYAIKGAAKEPRNLILEHPAPVGWTLTKPDAKGLEKSEGNLRLPVSLKAGEQLNVEVILERPIEQTLALTTASREQIAAFATAVELDKPTRDNLIKVIALHAEVEKLQRSINDSNAQDKAIVEDQGRVRENLRQVPANSDLYRRYLTKLDGQETELEKLRAARRDIQETHEKARQTLADFVAKL